MLEIILSSCPPEHAPAVADGLVGQRVAACVSILPGAVSTYRWKGEIQRESESLLLIKVPVEKREACVEALRALHPYTVPEIVVLRAQDVAPTYLAWARGECEG